MEVINASHGMWDKSAYFQDFCVLTEAGVVYFNPPGRSNAGHGSIRPVCRLMAKNDGLHNRTRARRERNSTTTNLPPLVTTPTTILDAFGPGIGENSTATDTQPTTSASTTNQSSPSVFESTTTISHAAADSPTTDLPTTGDRRTSVIQASTPASANAASETQPTTPGAPTTNTSTGVIRSSTGTISNATTEAPTTSHIPTTRREIAVVIPSSTSIAGYFSTATTPADATGLAFPANSSVNSSGNRSADTGGSFGPAVEDNATTTEAQPTTRLPSAGGMSPTVRQSSITPKNVIASTNRSTTRNDSDSNSTAFIAAVPSRSVPSDPLVGTVDVRTAATLLVLCALRFVLAPFLPTALAPIIQEGWSSRVVEDDGFKNLVTGIPVLLGRILTGWSFYFYRCCWLLSLCVFGCFFFPEPLCKFMANHGIVRLGGFAFWFLRFINLFCGYVFF